MRVCLFVLLASLKRLYFQIGQDYSVILCRKVCQEVTSMIKTVVRDFS